MTRRNFSRLALSAAGGLPFPRLLSPQVGRPNVIWIMSDAQRSDSRCCYGSSWVFGELKFGYQGYRDDRRLVMIRKGHLKLSRLLDPQKPNRFAGNLEGSLYDLENDPGEIRNLFRSTDHTFAVRPLTKETEIWDRSRTDGATA